jgi:hypothetical protein
MAGPQFEKSVRAEPVEALFFSFDARGEEGQGLRQAQPKLRWKVAWGGASGIFA